MTEIVIDPKLLKRANEILAERGTTMEQWLKLQLKSLIKHRRVYNIREKLTFGKYEGEIVEDVIRADPSYMSWCLRTIAGFALSFDGLELLSTMDVDL